MSYEVWGDGPEDDGLRDPDDLRKEGWWDEDTVATVEQAVQELAAETLYEGGNKANGVSERFLMRLTLLKDACGLMKEPHELALVAEAKAALSQTAARAGEVRS